MANRITKAWDALIGRSEQAPEAKSSSGPWVYGSTSYGDFSDAVTGAASFQQIAKSLYEQNVIGYKCVSLIANAIGGLEWYLKKDDKEIEEHVLLDRLNRPNPLQGKGSFFAHAAGSLLLDGNLFIEGVGPAADGPSRKHPPRELWVLSPEAVRVNETMARLPQSYTYTSPGFGGGPTKTFIVNQIDGSCQLLHMKSYSPLASPGARGLGPAKAAWLSLLTHTESVRWNHSLLKNGARPSIGFFEQVREGVPQLSQEHIDSIRKQVDELYAGAGKSGRPLIVPGGLTAEEMSINPKDMDWVNGKNSAAQDIALAFSVPAQLVGIQGSLTYANYAEARRG